MLDEVVRPDVVRMLWPQTQARAVVEPKACPLRLASRNLEPLVAPDPLDALHVHRPAVTLEQSRDPTVAVAPVLEGQSDDGGRQSGLVLDQDGDLALRRTMLPQDTAGETFGHAVLGNDVSDTRPAASRAQKFCWRCPSGPDAASFKMSFSRARSEIARRRRWFSVSKDFSRLT